jgi:hypothetical protein
MMAPRRVISAEGSAPALLAVTNELPIVVILSYIIVNII